MSTRLSARLGAGCGIAYVVLIMIAGELGPGAGMPTANASQATIGTYVAQHAPTTSQWAAAYLELIALLAFVVFVAYLWRVLREADREGWLPSVAMAGGLLTATIKLAGLPAAFTVLYRADDGISAQLATALVDMNTAAFAATWLTIALMLAATAAVALGTGVLPRWLAWSAVVTAVLLLASVPFFVADPPTFMLAILWIIAASVVLIRRADAAGVEADSSGDHAKALALRGAAV
jgi:hypothetical protein